MRHLSIEAVCLKYQAPFSGKYEKWKQFVKIIVSVEIYLRAALLFFGIAFDVQCNGKVIMTCKSIM